MVQFLFTKAILGGIPIDVFNNGKIKRDFTYIDDVVGGIIRVSDNKAASNLKWPGDNHDPRTSTTPYRIYNIVNNQPVGWGTLLR